MYNVGDKVVVVDAQQGIKPMQNLIGKICTISSVNENSYSLKEDGCLFLWASKWLTPYTEEPLDIQEESIMDILGA